MGRRRVVIKALERYNKRIMGRRRVVIKAIERHNKRYASFTKRRRGLFKETKKLCDSCNADAAVIVFSKAGNAFCFGRPCVIDRYLSDSTSVSDADNGVEESLHGDGGGTTPLAEAEMRIHEAIENPLPAWDVMIGDLGLSQLDELQEMMSKIRGMVVERGTVVAGRQLV